ncbi:MAG: hypothetical protein SGJ21_16970 [Alphaproteobacteria bacterium]|nr:hypothetical protein [Alphaproteobacteria bacterium]
MTRHDLASLERRVRRAAARHGFNLLKAKRLDARIRAHGGYMLRNDSFEIVFGDKDYPFCADLDDLETFLTRLGEA